MRFSRTQLRRRRLLPKPDEVGSYDHKGADEQRRLRCMFGPDSSVVTRVGKDYWWLDQLGPLTRQALAVHAEERWSAWDVVREFSRRGWNKDNPSHDEKMSVEVLRRDKKRVKFIDV